MKKFFAILALTVVIFTVGVTVIEATSIEKYCWDKCGCWIGEGYDCDPCYADCVDWYSDL